jgi:hypothetical protein
MVDWLAVVITSTVVAAAVTAILNYVFGLRLEARRSQLAEAQHVHQELASLRLQAINTTARAAYVLKNAAIRWSEARTEANAARVRDSADALETALYEHRITLLNLGVFDAVHALKNLGRELGQLTKAAPGNSQHELAAQNLQELGARFASADAALAAAAKKIDS